MCWFFAFHYQFDPGSGPGPGPAPGSLSQVWTKFDCRAGSVLENVWLFGPCSVMVLYIYVFWRTWFSTGLTRSLDSWFFSLTGPLCLTLVNLHFFWTLLVFNHPLLMRWAFPGFTAATYNLVLIKCLVWGCTLIPEWLAGRHQIWTVNLCIQVQLIYPACLSPGQKRPHWFPPSPVCSVL